MTLLHYLVRRFALFSFVCFALSIFIFALGYLLPGDALTNFSGQQNLSALETQRLMTDYQLDRGILSQYWAFLERTFAGDWGVSFASGNSVFEHVVAFFPATFELCVYALMLSIILGVPLGILAAVYQHKWPAKLINGASLVGFSTPVFWLALILIMVFCLNLGWFPLSGRISLLYDVPHQTGFMLLDIYLSQLPNKTAAMLDALHHLCLPTIVLAMYPTTVLIRFTRDAMMHVLEQNYIKTARAKGLTKGEVIVHHALRNALIPVIKQIGLQFSTLITLAMITEVIFSWPGLGRFLIDSIYQRDFSAIQGGVLAISIFVITATILADLIHTFVDPISRNQSHGKI